MGGGGSLMGGTRSKSAGLMSWGEAWSVWKALQQVDALTRETQKIWLSSADRQEREAAATRLRAEWILLPGRLAQAATPLLSALLIRFTGGQATRTGEMPNRFSEAGSSRTTTPTPPFDKLQRDIRDVGEKVAILLGDARLKLDEIAHQGREGVKRLLLAPARTLWMMTLAQLNNLNNLTESLRQELRSVWRSLERSAKALIDSLRGWLTGSGRDSSREQSGRDNKRKREKERKNAFRTPHPAGEAAEEV
jgi:hypothetical protein